MTVVSIEKAKKETLKNKIYQFRIDIKGAKPPIWRRVLVEKNICFGEFHEIIQNIFDWEDSHLHQFVLDMNTAIVCMDSEFYEPIFEKEYDEEEVILSKIFKKVGDKIEYVYDFGDDWIHTVKLEEILDKEEDKNYPYLVTGKMAAPVEDCGGIWGWTELCEAMKDKNHERREEFLEYYNEFKPDEFTKEEIEEINEFFKAWDDMK